MVAPPNGGGHSTMSAPKPSAASAAPSLAPRPRSGLTSSSVAMASNLPLSARRADPLDMNTVARKVPASKEPPPRTHINGIPEAPTFTPTAEEWRDPFDYMRKIAPEGKKYGIVKIIPPDGWMPNFAVDTERFHFRTRKQELNSCEGGTRANLDYLDQLTRYHKSQGMVFQRFPSVDKRPLDLYELKKAVESRGGFERVCKGKKWAEIGRILGYSGKIMSSLSTSLKNSYAKWLEPYERYLQNAKPAVHMQMEQERGGPYTPSPGPSPMKKTPSNQHTPSSLSRESPAVRASQALNDSIESRPTPPSRPLFNAQGELNRPSGFTAVNAGPTPAGFTAVNNPAQASPSETASAQTSFAPSTNGFASFSAPPNGYAAYDLKRSRSDSGDPTTAVDNSDERRSKRVKKEQPPTVSGSFMNQPKSSAQRFTGVKERNHWGPGDFCEVCGKGNDDQNILLCDSCHNGYHTYCLNPPLKSVPDFDWHCPKCLVGTGEFGFEEGGTYSLKQFQERAYFFKENHFKSKQHYDPILDRPREPSEDDVEREFWRLVSSLTETVEVEYGADIHSTIHGSGFPTIETHPRDSGSTDPWNLNLLPYHQDSLFRYIKSDISGMTVPWLYVGMVFSTFCWHAEDHWTYSANYQHFGQTKTWYGIPGDDAERFEEAMRAAVPDLFEKQPDLLFQLVTLIEPGQLKKAGVNVYAVDQRAGQLVITFPRAFHAGFNHGFNFNEAVNFAPPDWEPFGQAGVENLRGFRKQAAFSHDALLVTAAGTKDMPIKTAKWLAPALEQMQIREVSNRAAFDERVENKQFKPRDGEDFNFLFERVTDYEDEDEDAYICHYCKGFAYLSRFVCHNSNKVACLDHIAHVDCCQQPDGHSVHVRLTNSRLDSLVQRISDKSKVPETWIDKFEALIAESPKPQLKALRALLAEGERIPWPLPQLNTLKRFVDHCNEWVDEAQSYITRKQQNRRKNQKAWRRGSAVKALEADEKDDDAKRFENMKKLLKEADRIGFECQEIATLQERVESIQEFQRSARTALAQITEQTTQQIDNLLEVGRAFPVDIPEVEHLEKIGRQMKWKDAASDRAQARTLADVVELIEEADSIDVPESNEHLLWLKDRKLRGDMWGSKAQELMAVENVHFAQLDALSKQAAQLPVSQEILASVEAILKKQRDAQDAIMKLWERTKLPDLRDRPKYKELNDLLESISGLNTKPPVFMDLERVQKRHEDWMRRGKKLFGKTNAPLHILHQHLQLIDERNKHCFSIADKPRLPVEPSSREATPEFGSEGPPLFCLCRLPESGLMIECHVCHEWYHGKCLKLPRGRYHKDDEFLCPVCDHTVKIPRDANRPKLEEMTALQDEIPGLPFQPDEEETIASLIDHAQAFRDHVSQYLQPNPVLATLEEAPVMRFYLRKIEGADILLADETNFFRQELYRLIPIARDPPPIIEASNNTRKPRPTKAQKLMAQYGVDKPEDLPAHVQPKPAGKRKSTTTSQGANQNGTEQSAGSGRENSASESHSRLGSASGPSKARSSAGPGATSGPATNPPTPTSIHFRAPLTATHFPEHHLQDNRMGRREDAANSMLIDNESGDRSPSAAGSPQSPHFGAMGSSPVSQSANIFDSSNAAGLAAFAEQANRLGDPHEDDDGPDDENLFPDTVDDMPEGSQDNAYGNMFNELTNGNDVDDVVDKDGDLND